ncbi:hypothetical protein [Haloarcula laminariae]|uniref:hypothetical protein n=1 Tax=Haloarcula laminariae TaxID=2961577 RepID=UPI0021C95664|nr:hypothetical protein [Halomicroarcula laminariae]
MVRPVKITLPEQDDEIGTRLPEPDGEMFDKLKEKYNFPYDSEAARCFLKLGMMSAVDNDPRHVTASETNEDFSPVTIRQLVPEGADNAVDMTDEFWEQILRDEMMDIVADDPAIHRDGFKIYK